MKRTAQTIGRGMLLALGLPAVAPAGVELYGQARVSVDFAANNDIDPAHAGANFSVSSNASRIGLKGDEDLGNGLSLIWQLENQADFDTGAAFAKQRTTFVGMSGGFGSVMGGKLDTPYKSSTQYLDIFIDTAADFSAVMNHGHDLRASNTVEYVTPDMHGFKGAAAYLLSDASTGNDELPATGAAIEKKGVSVSGNYRNGPYTVLAAYELLSKQGSNGDDADAWKIGGSYTVMDATTIGLIYEDTDLGGLIKDRNAFYVNVSHKIGATNLKLAYGNIDKCGGGTVCDNTGAEQLSLGVSQAITKNTEVYALYSQVSNDNNAAFGLVSGSSPVTGQDMSAFSVGINHMFSSK